MTKEIKSSIGRLRAIKSEELELMLSWRNAPTVRANMYTAHEIGLTEHLAWWEKIQGSSDQQYFMYELDALPLGIVAFNRIDKINKNSSWAFYASTNAPRGTGIKMEYLALEYAFNKLCLHKLCCEVLEFNSAVIKLHEKFGFKVEGIFREQHKSEDIFIDIFRLGMLSTEWSVKREEMRLKVFGRLK